MALSLTPQAMNKQFKKPSAVSARELYCRPLRAAVLLNERPYTGVILLEAIRNLSHIAKVRFLIQIFGSSNSAEQLNNREIGTTSFSDLSHIDNECYVNYIKKC